MPIEVITNPIMFTILIQNLLDNLLINGASILSICKCYQMYSSRLISHVNFISAFALRLLSREQSENADVSISSQGFGNLNQLNNVSDVVQVPDDSSMALCSSGINSKANYFVSCFVLVF